MDKKKIKNTMYDGVSALPFFQLGNDVLWRVSKMSTVHSRTGMFRVQLLTPKFDSGRRNSVQACARTTHTHPSWFGRKLGVRGSEELPSARMLGVRAERR